MEKVTSTAYLVGSGLKDILHFRAQRLMRLRSWFMSTAAVVGSWTTVKIDVLLANSFTSCLLVRKEGEERDKVEEKESNRGKYEKRTEVKGAGKTEEGKECVCV